MYRWLQRVKRKQYHCVGCGNPVAWDGKGVFSYTCPCGATLFADENGKIIMPYSLIKAIIEHREPRHIDYYVGKSNYISLEKLKVIKMLQQLGACWSWECPKCKPKIVQRTIMEIKQGFYRLDIHPELKKLIEEEKGEKT